MTTIATPTPGSLPDLIESKSSNSSLLHSSSIDAEGILSDISNFEDIGLDEGIPVANQELYGYNRQARTNGAMQRPTSSAGSQSRKGSPAIGPLRQLTNGSKTLSYMGSFGQVHGAAENLSHSLSLPKGSGMRTSLGSSMPSLTIATMNLRNQSRSPSPSHQLSSRPVSRGTLNGRPCSSKGPMSRRSSLQPSRKSTKELEAEYNDADNDLPEDANLWNVPLSPRPAQERNSFSAATSPNPSTSTSPERPATLRGGPAKGAYLPVGPSAAPAHTNSNQTLSSSLSATPPLLKPKLVHSATMGAVPDGCTRTRAKSWTIALSELSEEAKTLTELLETHADRSERLQGDAIQSGSMAINSDPDILTRSKTYSVELPPLRTTNAMLDPLPISKEKEKVLSRTRPSWLPPKDRKEEKKHLREYQRMMESSLEAERKRAASTVENKCIRDDTQTTLLRIWEEHVLPHWSQVIREPRTRELWWRGIAPRSRGEVWQRAIGNELALTEATYVKALQRANYVEQRIGKEGSDETRKEKAWFNAIRRDAKATFPELKLFLSGSPLHDDLVDVLMAYSMYRSDVGYSHSTHLITAHLLLHLPTPAVTFVALSNLLNRPLPLAFLTGDPAATQRAYALTLSLLAVKYPRLHAHLFIPTDPPVSAENPKLGLNLNPATVLEPLMRTMFLGPSPHGGLDLEVASRVWDVMVFEGDALIIRAAVATIGSLESRLYGNREDVLGVLGWGDKGKVGAERGWDVGGEDSFMARVRWVGKEERGRV